MATNSKQSVHMNPGQGETSYAQNSALQKTVQDRMKTLIEEAVTGLCTGSCPHPKKDMVIADLGCSSGPNALTLVSAAIDAIHRYCTQHEQLPPDMCVLLNDLPDNDFNNVAKSLDTLKHNGEALTHPVVLITGMVPGSFYERLFARGSLHLVCSANSLHWLSEAPEDLKKSRIPMHDSDEQLRSSTHQIVADSYARQFRKDFMQFLRLRAQELVPGGRMVVSLLVRCSDKPNSEFIQPWTSVVTALSDMALRGVISKEKLDSFYIPIYSPMDSEVNKIIEEEGSFQINKMLMHDPYGGTGKALLDLKMVALRIRAVFEPIIVQHFAPSDEIMDDFMKAVERHLISSGALEARLSVQDRMKTLIEEAVTGLCTSSCPHPKDIVITDLGCSSGPNALTLVSAAHSCEALTHPVAVITGMVPGSFYERLFARGSLHLAPEDLKKSRIPIHDSDEQLRSSRHQIVADSYARQYRKDFMRFLSLRAQEIVPGGRMVVSLLVRCSDKPDTEFIQPWTSVVKALSDMALRVS
uniref:Jasmonate O-methyltransferase n=1 Tax=Oryza punctata TaxID=4537 RepID=A0A0E0LAY4_ORYPU